VEQNTVGGTLGRTGHEALEPDFKDQRALPDRRCAHHEGVLQTQGAREEPLLDIVLAFEHEFLRFRALRDYATRSLRALTSDADCLNAKLESAGQADPSIRRSDRR
jgi:hypothetical protein